MKRSILTTALLILFIDGAYDQTAEKQVKQFQPIDKKELDLKYFGSDSSSVLERIKKNDDMTSRFLQKDNGENVHSKKVEKPESGMPIIQPDSSVKFHIIAVVPDSTTQFHMRIKNPE